MARYKMQGTFVDQVGNVVPSGTVAVFLTGTSTAASIYTTSTSTTVVNSVTSNSTTGRFSFFVDNLDYDFEQGFDVVLSKATTSGLSYTSQTYANVSMSGMDVVTGAYTVSTARTISTHVIVPKGVTYTKSASGTMTFTGVVEIGRYPVFSGFSAGNITFTKGITVYPEWWGAVGDGSTDDITPINCAVKSASGGAKVIFTKPSYRITAAITIDRAVELCGSGAMLDTVIQTSSATADIITIASDNPVYIHDLTLTSSVLKTAGVSISVAGASGATINSHSRFERIYFGSADDYYFGHMEFTASGYWTVRGCTFTTVVAPRYAIKIKNTVNADTGDNLIEGNVLTSGTLSNITAIYHESGGGLRIIGNTVIGFEFAYWMNLTNSTGNLVISGNTFGPVGTTAIKLAQLTAGQSWNGVNISGNLLMGGSGGAINIVAGAQVWVNFVTITGNTGFAYSGGATGIIGNGIATGTISGNFIQGATGGVGINIGAASLNVTVEGNGLNNFGITVANASTSSTITQLGSGGVIFSNLPAEAANGSTIYVSDGTRADPVADSGTGCIAQRLNGTWKGN